MLYEVITYNMIKIYNINIFAVFVSIFAMLLLTSIYLTPDALSCGDSAKDSDKSLASNSSFEEPVEPETEPIDEVSKSVDDISEKLPVITSYSIHYTKLYELPHGPAGASHEPGPAQTYRRNCQVQDISYFHKPDQA